MRNLNFKIIIILFIGLFLSSISNAQEVRKLNLEQCIKIGLINSKTIHSSKMSVLEAEAQMREMNTNGLPSLSFNATYTRLSKVPPFTVAVPGLGSFNISPSIFDNYSMALSLKQPLFTGFKLSSSYDMAKYNSLAAKQTYSQDEQNLILNIKNAYWNLFKAIKIKEVIDENVQQVKAHLTDIQNFYKQGLATKNEVLKVEVQLSDAQLNQIDAKNAVKLAGVNLNNVLGLPLSTGIEIQDSISVKNTSNLYNMDQLISEAQDNRPELKAMEYKVKASEKGITLAQSDWYPQIFLAGEYNYAKPNQRLLPTKNEFYGTWDVSVGLSLSLWNWGATLDKTDQAKAQYEQANDGLKTLKDAVTLEVTQDYYNLVKASEKVIVAEEAVKQAEENYRVTDDKFKQGITLNSELLDAETALKQVRTNYTQALVDYELAKAQIEKATGKNFN